MLRLGFMVVHNRIYLTGRIGVMTSGGLTKHRAAKWMCGASFIAALLFAIEFWQNGQGQYKALMIGAMMAGFVCGAGAWITSFDEDQAPGADQ